MIRIQELLERLDMASYLDYEGFDYKEQYGHRGVQLNVKECPACGDTRWKVYLNAETGLGNCFHGDCQATFNKYSFIKACLGGETGRVVGEHIRSVVRDLGWVPKQKARVTSNEETEVKLPLSLDLPIDGKNLKYLKDRGISLNTATYFHLKYCEYGFNQFSMDGEDVEQYFGERIIIPVFDLKGNLVTYQGRDITGAAKKKYLFPMGLPATGRYLYNGHQALKATRVVVGEGAFDVMGIKQALEHTDEAASTVAVGTFGMHLSSNATEADQVGAFYGLMKHGLKEVVFMWDGENKAYQMAIEACCLLNRMSLTTKIATLPQGRDPGAATIPEMLTALSKAEEVKKSTLVRLKLNSPYTANS